MVIMNILVKLKLKISIKIRSNVLLIAQIIKKLNKNKMNGKS
jgi:hypothetical protein